MTGRVNVASAQRLAGISVLITRPVKQGQRTAQAIAAAGGDAIVFPTIAILPLENDAALRALAERLDEYQMAIFVSANAVEQGMPYLLARCRISAQLCAHLAFAAIGEATAQALRDCGIAAVLTPQDRYDSEALLELAPLHDVAGKRIVIFRGEGGRETLATTLRGRGGLVDYAVCYRRVVPSQDARSVQARWKAGQILAVSAMSLESLNNLRAMLDDETRKMLAITPVMVPHPRVAEAARAMGIRDVRVTGTSDEALIESLQALRKQ